MKKLWEELNCLEPRPRCVCSGCKCDLHKKLEDIDSANNVMQFLMGLNDSYSSIVSNILLLDPLPTFNKACSIISRVERQRIDVVYPITNIEASALAVKFQDRTHVGSKNFSGKRENIKKGDRSCTYCNKSGHLEDACFKKHGYPEWFKEQKKKQQTQMPKRGQNYANNVNCSDSDDPHEPKHMDATTYSRDDST